MSRIWLMKRITSIKLEITRKPMVLGPGRQNSGVFDR
jgi:hypothetical protein